MLFPYIGPQNRQIEVPANKKQIARLFTHPIEFGGTGRAYLRKNSKNGEIIETFSEDNNNVLISANELVLEPSNQLPYETKIFLTLDDGFIRSKITGEECCFLNENSETTFSFTTEDPIGKELDGGIILSKNGGRYLIVSPKECEINVPWDQRDKAIEKTQEITGTSGWFIPSWSLLSNPELNNINLWVDYISCNFLYWTNDEQSLDKSYCINITNGFVFEQYKTNFYNIRTFKFANI